LFFGIELILRIEKTGHFLVVAIVKGINENMATKIPDVLPSKPSNLKSPNHKRKIPKIYLNMASKFPTFFCILFPLFLNDIRITGRLKKRGKLTVM
jgi:hypothetical protein